ncbi:MAG: glycosyltransferase [Limimaricola sp.]|uniref:glycosyltransferase n=1 Tax=Limimaricola sp. TaxID=2211665 RepID=UPI001D3DC7A3|nr:glycosyltransferase [Limimaricola sp.]MBI1417262.1 glycosyltransferase [Limimaricola sp.]
MRLPDMMAAPLHSEYRKLRAAAGAIARKAGLHRGPYRGHVDGLRGDTIQGWVVHVSDQEGGLKVGLYLRDGLIDTALANLMRADVDAAGIGDGRCGFAFRLTPPMMEMIARAGGRVSIRVMNGAGYRLGDCAVCPAIGPVVDAGPRDPVKADRLSACRKVADGLLMLSSLIDSIGSEQSQSTPPPLERHGALFSHRSPAPPGQPDMANPTALPGYLDYTRFRYRQDGRFPCDADPDEVAHFLDWYLAGYSVMRNGLRVPLSRDLIAWLNADIVIGGFRAKLSRILWGRLMRNPALRAEMDLDNPHWQSRVLFWWAWHEAHVLHVEDCLVTPAQQAALRAVPSERAGQPFALSIFMDHHFAANPQLHFLDGTKAEDRKTYYLLLMVAAAARPDILRYLPPEPVQSLLAPDGGQPSAFDGFVRALTGQKRGPRLTAPSYAAALRQRGFDLATGSFLSVTSEGHRLEAAALPRPPGRPEVDVQIIGPLRKASGLGQAARLSAAVLDRTEFSVNHVDFGLDNPAPEGFSRERDLSGFHRAKVNLIHLNAESIPLAFAYGPDVFSDAYNIGYFFWELDTPAACHFLGMNLLDEIWVSSAYGVSIYRPHTARPVTNVGMTFEEPGPVDRAAARRAIDRRFHLKGHEFLCLVAFDSFSFVQRKNPLGVLRAFLAAFPNDPDARLIVKTQNRDSVTDPVQQRIWAEVMAMAASDPRILIVNETMPYDALIQLKAAADCYISLHRSEGWGFGMIEAMNLGVPVLCSAYSGNLEFCNDQTAWLVDCHETALGPDDYIFVRPGQKWAEPDIASAARQLRRLRADAIGRAARAAKARDHVFTHFGPQIIAARYAARLSAILADR